MTILVAVKKNGRVFLGADRIVTFGQEYFTDLVNGGKIVKLKHAYLATSGYTLMDNVLELMHSKNNPIMDNKFSTRAEVFQFMLELYSELKKQYTLTDIGKDTYASIHNVFLVVTDKQIYGISNNLTVTEYPSYVVKGAGADYSLGCLYALYETVSDGRELTRLALEAACHFCVYCKEPLDIIEVKASDFGRAGKTYKDHGQSMHTVQLRRGAGSIIRSAESKIPSTAKTKSSSTKERVASTSKKAAPASKAKSRAGNKAKPVKTASKSKSGK